MRQRHETWPAQGMFFHCELKRAGSWCGPDRPKVRLTWLVWRVLNQPELVQRHRLPRGSEKDFVYVGSLEDPVEPGV